MQICRCAELTRVPQETRKSQLLLCNINEFFDSLVDLQDAEHLQRKVQSGLMAARLHAYACR